MDLRTLPTGLSPAQRCEERRKRLERELGLDLGLLRVNPATVGQADERNCEQMFGNVPIPVGYAGPLPVTFSSGETVEIHLPLATTEGALVASVNRGCKALRESGGVRIVRVIHHGATRSLAFRIEPQMSTAFTAALEHAEGAWKRIAEETSEHLKVLSYHIAVQEEHLFLTIACDTDEAMGMNMVTTAAQAAGEWIAREFAEFGVTFVSVAGNVDSDKKASRRTHDLGRGYEVQAEALIQPAVISSILKTTPEKMLAVAHAKLDVGSTVAGALGRNLHAANVIAALYLATGQDAAHVVEGSLADTEVTAEEDGLRMKVRCPALMVGIRGGGTTLPAQHQSLALLLKTRTLRQRSVQAQLHPAKQLAESIGAAVLAGELSLLAALASHSLAAVHARLGRHPLQ